MSTDIDYGPVKRAVEREIKAAGGVRALGRLWGVSPSHITDLRWGRRGPGPKILSYLGLTMVEMRSVRYWPTTKETER